jgi:hypothetical protein
MRIEDVPGRLASIGGRTPGSDGERRAALWLRDQLRADGERVAVETVWVRPGWALSLGGYLAVAVAGSAISVSLPGIGLAVLVAALACTLGDLTAAPAAARWLTPARATQNVVVEAGATEVSPAPGRLRLVLTANIDAGRTGSVYRDGWVRAESRLRRGLGGHLASVPGLLALLIAVLAALAGARLAGAGGTALGVAQLIPTVLALVALALLADILLSPPSPGANVNASGVAAALAVFRQLRRSPPENLDVCLVLGGAGEAGALGVRRYLHERRRRGWRAQDVAVLALEPCGTGTPCYLTHEGPLLALRLHPQLVACARAAAAGEPLLGARARRSHAGGAAYAARRRRWPAIAVGAVDAHDRPGPAHRPDDLPERLEQRTLADTVELCLALIDKLDAGIGAAGKISHERAGSI